mgnify:CR=1 FL=1
MPIVKLIDGTNIFVDSNDPAVIAEAKQKAQKQKTKRLKKRGSGSVVGDIGRGIAAGVVSIPQGIATIPTTGLDRKSTRPNSSHLVISYAVFCLKKKKQHVVNNLCESTNQKY